MARIHVDPVREDVTFEDAWGRMPYGFRLDLLKVVNADITIYEAVLSACRAITDLDEFELTPIAADWIGRLREGGEHAKYYAKREERIALAQVIEEELNYEREHPDPSTTPGVITALDAAWNIIHPDSFPFT